MAEDYMFVTPLGAGQEVGRSCHVLEFRGITILLDCGIHPGFDGLNGLPYLDRIEPDQVDVVLITHFHLDHAASLPYLTERTNFKGRVFMTHPTKAVLKLLLGDYLRLLEMRNSKPEDVLYTEAELHACLEKVELIDYHQTVQVGGALSFYALNAGHVLGACMFMIEIGGRSVLYTGDYSMEDDRHLMAAEVPHKKPDLLIVESTFGVQVHASRAEREARFTGTIERVVSRGGRCLIPVFALGRAQELLLILDEYWQANPQLQDIPIYYASKLASRALRVYQTYANMMNAKIRAQMDVSNPFHFRFIQNLKNIDVNNFDDSGPSVVFASPGMLQSGVSRQLFDRWAGNPNNGVMIAGYAVDHTLAREIMTQPKEVVTLEGRRQPLNCLVDYVSFSAHVDFVQNRSFIQQVSPNNIILVHGAMNEMRRLMNALNLQYKQLPENKQPKISMPPNLQDVKLLFSRVRRAKVMGRLAMEEENREHKARAGQPVRGILVSHNFQSKIVAPEDLAAYTPLRVGSVLSKLHVPFGGSVQTLQLFLTEMFAGMTVQTPDNDDEPTVFKLGELVQVVVVVPNNKNSGKCGRTALVEWDASPQGDVLADAVVALILHTQSSAASVRMTSQPCRHYRVDDDDNDNEDDNNNNNNYKRAKTRSATVESRLKFIYRTLKDQFDCVEATYEGNEGTFEIQTDSGFGEKTAAAAAVAAQAAAVKKEDPDDGDGDACNDDNSNDKPQKDLAVQCTVKVIFDAESDAEAAHVAVESVDAQLAANVRDCIQALAEETQPIRL